MESVTPDALRPERARQRQPLGYLRHAAVEGGVEAGDLRDAVEARRDGLDARDRRRQVKRCERRERPQRRDERGRDALGRRVVGAPVDHAMADGIGRVEFGGVECGEGGAQRGLGIGERARRLALDAPRVVTRGDAPSVRSDLLDSDGREPRLIVVERELQRR